MNGYELSRAFFDWSFENPNKINPNHIALYFFCIEHCNRLGWKDKFGLPTTMAKEAIGIRSYNTYKKTLEDLVEFGFVEMIEVSKNQYSSNIIALSKFNKALDKALDKALIKHTTKQSESTQQSIDSIDKQLTIKQETNNKAIPEIDVFMNYFKELSVELKLNYDAYSFTVQAKYENWVENGWKDGNGSKIKNWKTKLKNTIPFLKPIWNNQQPQQQVPQQINYKSLDI